MKTRLFAIVIATAFFCPEADAATLEFEGTFSDIQGATSSCADVFSDPDYSTKHVSFGPNGKIIVTNFSGADGAFLDGVNLVANLGYFDDALYTDTVEFQGTVYKIELYMVFSYEAVYGEASVWALNSDGEETCSVSATFLGT